MRALITIALLSSACGTYEAPNSGSTETTGPKPSIEMVHPTPAPKEVITEYRKDGSKVSRVVKTSSDLEPCDNNIHGQSVLIRVSDTSLECHGPSATWIQIVPQKTNVEPKAPTEEPKAIAPRELQANEWRDPVTSLVWLIGTSAPFDLLSEACTGTWRIPRRGEAIPAVLRGLGQRSVDVGGPNSLWTGDLDMEFPKTMAKALVFGGTSKEESRDHEESHGVFCVEKPTSM